MPNIVKEVRGVLHSKLFLFDNNVIISGANLSNDYFTNRIDRYWIFQQHEPFADFCEDYINTLMETAQKLTIVHNAIVKREKQTESNAYFQLEDKNYDLQMHQHFYKMLKYEHRVKIAKNEDLKIDDYFNNLNDYNNIYIKRISEQKFLDFKTSKKELIRKLNNEEDSKSRLKLFEEFKKEALDDSEYKKVDVGNNQEKDENISEKEHEDINLNEDEIKENDEKPGTNEVLVFPTFQHKTLNINDDENMLYGLLEYIKKEEISKIKISTGYFNPQNKLKQLLVNSGIDIDIITSAPEANSFFNAKGIKKHVPYFYRRQLVNISKASLSRNKDINKNRNSDLIKCYEYNRNEWSFHAKGMWFYNKNSNYPVMSIIGSSNFSKSFNIKQLTLFITIYKTEDLLKETLRVSFMFIAETQNLISKCIEK